MAQLLMLILLFCCAMFHFSFVDARICSNFIFSRQLGKRLRCSIYKTLSVGRIDCHKECVSEVSCFSINFYPNENGTDVCELIKATTSSLGIPDCLEWKQESEYNELISTATTSFCSSSVSCNSTGKNKKALPGNWYQLGSSAFKLFEEKKSYSEASAVCSANGATLATINSDDENNFVNELYVKEEVSKRDLLIKDKLKPHKRWKLDGSDQDMILHGSLLAKKDEYNRSAALHFTGTAGSYATTPAWDISTMTFSISLWVQLESMPSSSYYFYSYWYNPYIFALRGFSNGALGFGARKKSNHNSDLFVISGGQAVLNKWTHIVLVWNRQTKQALLYQDGRKVSQTTPLTTSDLDFSVPIRSVFDVGYKRDSSTVMKGWLRELLVFDRALTSEEVNIVQDATLLDPRIWIGAPQSYLNMAPVSKPNTNCFSERAWGTFQWEEVPCDRELEFLCKKNV